MDEYLGKIVRVVWLDHTSEDEWHNSVDKKYNVARMITCGKVIEVGDDYIVVASTWEDKEEFYGHVHTLVAPAIKEIGELS